MAEPKTPAAPDPVYVESASAVAIDKFVAAMPPQLDDEVVMFGRAPLETRVTAGMLRNGGEELASAVRAYVGDIKKSLYDEYVVKHAFGRSITVGDLRDYADQKSAPAKA